MEKENQLKKYNQDKLPDYFKDLSDEQQLAYLNKMADNDIEIKKYAKKKGVDSKIAEHDMTVDLEYLGQLETENKMVNIKRNYKTGSGEMKVDIKGGDKNFLIPILVVVVIGVIGLFVVLLWR